jgi:oxygen-independent coproporphyrinogen-3 oxidase
VHLYLHIPFCHQACHYCDFHFSTRLAGKSELVNAMIQEIALQKDYLGTRALSTVYFGGGTPSTLNPTELSAIFEAIHAHFDILQGAEITLEANPEDLTPEYLKVLKGLGVNRLSIGIQSFHAVNLTFMNRNHDVLQARKSIQDAQAIGLTNISIDLIYGIPSNNMEMLEEDLATAVATGVQHISAYSLTIEPKTVFGHQLKKGILKETPEEGMSDCFEFTHQYLENHGFTAYETSNFAKAGYESKHNSSYWKQKSYLGIGPAAHSFNQTTRQWNIANNASYVKQISQGILPAEIEQLSPENQINEYIMTQLRTDWGIDLSFLRERFQAIQATFPEEEIASWISNGYAVISEDRLKLVGKGKLIADGLSAEIFVL